MKKSDLYREWARVLDMCEGTTVLPTSAWKFKNHIQDDKLPNFEYDNPELFEFTVAILEDKPVFIGDTIYNKRLGSCHTVTDGTHISDVCWSGYSWNPPKKTFTLNGEELPCPDGNKGGYQIGMFPERYYFTDFHDAQKVVNAINKLLQDATK